MSDPVDRGWSSRRKFTLGGTLGAIASLVTIVSFLSGTGHGMPAPTPPPSTSPPVPFHSSSPAGSSSLAGAQYPTSAAWESSYLSSCEQNTSEPASYCQCDLSWLKANVTYSTFVQDPATFEEMADSNASC